MDDRGPSRGWRPLGCPWRTGQTGRAASWCRGGVVRNGDILKTSLTGLGGDWKGRQRRKESRTMPSLLVRALEKTVAIYGDGTTWVGRRDQELSTGHVKLETLQRHALELSIKQLDINNGNYIYIFLFIFLFFSELSLSISRLPLISLSPLVHSSASRSLSPTTLTP